MTGVIGKELQCISLICFRPSMPPTRSSLRLRCQAEHGIVLIIVGSCDKTYMVERDAIAAEIDIRLVVGEDQVAAMVFPVLDATMTPAPALKAMVLPAGLGAADRVVRGRQRTRPPAHPCRRVRHREIRFAVAERARPIRSDAY